MRLVLKLAFVVLVVAPMIVLQGAPDLAPAWLWSEAGGVPVVIWAAMAWFALLIIATWLPEGDRERM